MLSIPHSMASLPSSSILSFSPIINTTTTGIHKIHPLINTITRPRCPPTRNVFTTCSMSSAAPSPRIPTTSSSSQLRLDDLSALIFSMVMQTDRGATLTKEQHLQVAELTGKLSKYCIDSPVTCPLIFGDWDVVYCSNPTSAGGGFRSRLGRVIFRTKEMIQLVEAPDTVRNKVSFSVLGFLDGEVSLKGKLIVLDEKWIKVVFEPPEVRLGSLEFQFGGESVIQLETTYIDKKLRLGKGSRGSVFVFQRRT